jgi:hypothetical protein
MTMTAQELLDHLTAIKELHNLSELQVVFEDHDNSLNVQYFNVYSARIKIVDKELILTNI